MKRENRYVVLKLKDLQRCFTDTEFKVLEALCDKVNYYRDCVDKEPLQCLVIESDWPEYDTAWESIVKRMKND